MTQEFLTNIDLSGNTGVNFGTPTEDFHAATKKYVDDSIIAGSSGASALAKYLTWGEEASLTNSKTVSGDSGISVNLAQDPVIIAVDNYTGITGHTGDSTIHFTESSIDHTAIQSVGSNTHAQIDTHIASTSNPHSVTAAQVGALVPSDLDGLSGNFTGFTGAYGEVQFLLANSPTTPVNSRVLVASDGLGNTDGGAGSQWELWVSAGSGILVEPDAVCVDFGIAQPGFSDIGSTSNSGSAPYVSRLDHTHRGVHSVQGLPGGSQLFGDVVLSGYAGIDLVFEGNAIGISGLEGDFATNSKVDTLSGYTESHITNTSNPHSVTTSQIGAVASTDYEEFTGNVLLRDGSTTLTGKWDAGNQQALNLGVVMVQPTAPPNPASGQLWLDIATDAAYSTVALTTLVSGGNISITDTVVLCSGAGEYILPDTTNLNGKKYWIKNIGMEVVTITGNQYIDEEFSINLINKDSMNIVSNTSSWWIL